MSNNTNPLPDNLISKFSRAYVSKNSFKADDGQTVEYERFCFDYQVQGIPMSLEIPIKRDSPITQKDVMLLTIADTVTDSSLV